MRIVSLLPSATEIVCALGLEDWLVGVSHECDFPHSVVGQKTVVTSTILPKRNWAEGIEDDEPVMARDVDKIVREALERGESLYKIDEQRLRDLKPDLLLTQGLCDVCAVAHKEVVKAANALAGSATVLDLAPVDLAGVLESILQVGRATGQEDSAQRLTETMAARWSAVRSRTATATGERPRTLLLGWPDPPFSAGHWNPELLEIAGATLAPWDTLGTPSRTLSAKEIGDFAPEVLVLIGCGLDVSTALIEAYALPELEGWYDWPCVREAEVYIADGNAYFNRPGPRLAESAEILATILHPNLFDAMLPGNSVARIAPELLIPDDEDDLAEPSNEFAAGHFAQA